MVRTIQDLQQRFGTADQCLEYLFYCRYADTGCPKCHRRNAYHKHPTKRCYTCNCGQSHIYPMKGTIFQGSPIPLNKWFYAVFLMTQKPNGVSGKELERKLQVTYATAYRMLQRLRSVRPSEELWNTPLYFETYLANCAYGSADFLKTKESATAAMPEVVQS